MAFKWCLIIEEIWKPVVEYESYYEVSNLGKVMSISRTVKLYRGEKFMEGKILSPRLRNGHLAVELTVDGIEKTKSIHRLVAEVFCEKKDGCTIIDHIDANKLNNRSDNLEWVTYKENTNRADRLNLIDKSGLSIGPKSIIRRIKCVTTGTVYDSIVDANLSMGKNRYCSTLSATLRSGRSKVWGYEWKYVN